MSFSGIKYLIPLVAATALAVFAGASSAYAVIPVDAIPTSRFGREVDLTEVVKKGGPALEDVCTVESKDECRAGEASSAPDGFQGAEGVAGAANGNVYVADRSNSRVQEFTAAGQFVRMFGKEVNERTGGDVCTAEEVTKSAVKCKSGVEGTAPGQFGLSYSIAVDPKSGAVYVAEIVSGETSRERVQKFTPEGQFVLEIGKEVNETTKGNLCTREEEVNHGVKCTGPGQHEGAEPATFNFEVEFGDLLGVNEEGELYVGDEGRVQQFKPTGEFNREIPVEAGARVDGLVVDKSDNIYLTYSSPGTSGNIVRVFGAGGVEISSFAIAPEETGAGVAIKGLALDTEERLAVAAVQHGMNRSTFGSLYQATSGSLLSRFKIPTGREETVRGIGFNGSGDLYVATGDNQDILRYQVKPVAELVTGVSTCVEGAEHDTDVVMNCTLNGEVDPEGVAETEAWFEWGRTEALGEQTPRLQVATTEPVDAVIAVRPNETFYYRPAAVDANVNAPEELTGELRSFETPLVAPTIVGEPSVLFVKASSVVMFDELNPQNASTEYFFEYAPSEEVLDKCSGGARAGCPGVAVTPAGRSAVYGKIGASQEAIGLQPATSYSYRLFAEDQNSKNQRLRTVGSIGSFTTAAYPTPSVQTGGYSGVASTSATISGTITSNGAPTSYTFELGVYEGAATQYGAVFSGSVDPNSGPVVVTLPLSGLQPATTYAYRVSIVSGYIGNETHTLEGAPVAFATSGLPEMIAPPPVLAQLPTPKIAFPKATKGSQKAKGKRKVKAKKRRKHARIKSKKTRRK